MKGFFNLKKPSPEDAQKLAKALRESGPHTESMFQLAPIMDEFGRFLSRALTAVQIRAKGLDKETPLFNGQFGYDPRENEDRFLKDTWGMWADFWPLIETVPTYQITMLTILQKLRISERGTLRLASIGSGPGIYETFLARITQGMGIPSKFTCVDLAPEMAVMQNFIANIDPPPLRNLDLVTADMASLPLPNGSMDAVLCNNSLQWSKRWRKAIREMARILDPKGGRALYLVVHTHGQEMHTRTADGEKVIDMKPILIEEIFDELEANSFVISSSRQIHCADGMGQAGAGVDRAFICAHHEPNKKSSSWRKSKITVAGASAFNVNK